MALVSSKTLIYKILYYQDTVSDYPIYTALESRPDVWTPSFGQPSSHSYYASSTESNEIEWLLNNLEY